MLSRRFTSPHGATPITQLLSNGSYSVMITAAGSGYSHWRDFAVTRWRDDTTCDDTGSYIYINDVTSRDSWSATLQPSGVEPLRSSISFSGDRAEFIQENQGIETRLEVIVAPVDAGELRRVSLTNLGTAVRELDVTSYAEIVLATAASDAAHPTFSNLFIETECVPEKGMLLATRRRGAPDEPEIWLAHVIAVDAAMIGELEWETRRDEFIGRGRNVHAPKAVRDGYRLSGSCGAVLDPIVSLRQRVQIRPGETARLVFSTLVASSRAELLAAADKYRGAARFDEFAHPAAPSAAPSHDRVAIPEWQLFETLAGHLLYPDRALRTVGDASARHDAGVESLWAHGISGDLPVALVVLQDLDHVELVRSLVRAREYWRSKCLAVDLVVIDYTAGADTSSGPSDVETLVRTMEPETAPDIAKAQGKTLVVRTGQLTATEHDALKAVARVTLSSESGTLAQQLAAAATPDAIAPPSPIPPAASTVRVTGRATRTGHLEFFNGLGGFDSDGAEYVTVLRPGTWTPAPWINVIANADFGCLVSECGTGCTWSMNSQENLLTNWSNDPVSDPPSEMFYLGDVDANDLWTPTPLPIREHTGEYVVRHGHGYSRFEREAHGVAHTLLQFVPANDPIKISRLTLVNTSASARRLSVTAYLEWVLGVARSESASHVTTEIDAATGAMFAHNGWSRDFGTRVAFADLGGLQQQWTADRAEFIGRNGATDRPAALINRAPLSGRTGSALDPCCALQADIEIPVGGEVSVVFFMGQAESREAARALITRYRAADLDAQLLEVTDGWTRMLGTVTVKTPDRALDIMLNQWLLYQTLACRLWARTAFYQASGAYGFRDQLQDVMALALARPDLTRAQILRAAARQFLEGDVQHWWHPTSGAGIRTRIADDMLWLPYAVSHYIDVSGDRGILDAVVPFLEGAGLKPDQREAYFVPATSAEQGTVFEHCARALDRSLSVGVHGLPLMGTGDWNDGMNRVGIKGRGESVWLAWFLYTVLSKWAPVATARGETARATAWSGHAAALKKAVEAEGWGGDWYRRAFFDDGTPLGVAGADACAIDAIAQSWSVISGAADPARARRAMDAVEQHLVQSRNRLVLLLTPPFDKTALDPGYIKGYVPGVRENGGQYTHAAVWTAIAFAALGEGTRAAATLSMLNPITHSSSPDDAAQFRVEPYVSVGDVYSEPPHVGRGGWTWYTGSAGWMHRAGVEWLLGIRVHGDRLLIDPCIPSAWPEYTVALRFGTTPYHITVHNRQGTGRGVARLELDGIASTDLGSVQLVDDHQPHRVRAELGEVMILHATR